MSLIPLTPKLQKALFLLLIVLAALAQTARAQVGPTDQVKVITGMILAPNDPITGFQQLFLATEFGLLRSGTDGISELMTDVEFGLTGMAQNPVDPNVVLASGFGRDNKIPAILKSNDGGISWTVEPGKVPSLRAITFSPNNPEVVYAISKDLNVSRDGGKTWAQTGKLPGDVFDLAVSPQSPDTLYAASMEGLMLSRDGGETWRSIYPVAGPATMVDVDRLGQIIAYVYGVGLVTAPEAKENWQVLNTEFGQRYILNFLKDVNIPDRLYITTDSAGILLSRDGGKIWAAFEGSQRDTPENIAKGAALFAGSCQVCHGINAIGEAPGNPEAKDEFGFKAPALNDDAHGWHHPDNAIKATIRKGSPRNERMVAFKDTLSEEDISNIVTYLKSLWSLNSLACQGARHGACR